MSAAEPRGGKGDLDSLVARFLGLLLLAAAGLKLAAAFSHAHGGGQVLVFSTVCCELLLGLWLLSGMRPKWSLRVAAATFSGFAIAAVWMVKEGVSDCGCFGALSISPKITYWIDIAALLATLMALRSIRLRTLLPAILLPGMALYFGVVSFANSHQPAPRIGPGKPWPPARAISCPADLSKGRWIVLIYSSDCGRCRSLASDYEGDAAGWAARGKQTRLALLDADPPSESTPAMSPKVSSGIVRGELLQGDLYQHTPILLLLDHGIILAVEEGWAAADWSNPRYSSWVR